MSEDLKINGARLWDRLMEMARIGATEMGGCNRQALTDLDKQGRDLFISWAKAVGCTIAVDEVGNIFARLEGSNPDADPILMGSHLDTQATGGKFDGVYGVLAALEVVQTLVEAKHVVAPPLEIAVWTNEEGCRFPPAMLGSGVMSGAYSLEQAYASTDKEGRTLGEELDRIGYRGTLPASPRPYAAMLEAHIEQGPILEADEKTIGVVSGIQGAHWFDLKVTGASAHAGPTPMAMRKDPWRAVAPIVSQVLQLADDHAPWGRATIGDVSADPGARNTVPHTLYLSIDIRHPEEGVLASMEEEMRCIIADACAAANVTHSLQEVWHMPPTTFAPHLVDTIEVAADALGYSSMRLVSGAGHDSLHTAQFAPTAMIFVPCADGLSHNELESAEPADLEAGANVLLRAIANLGEAQARD
ncbi:Zn-dependent hydrolase [Aurantiacibacter rhizosphaerae]|uniref:Hydantoinase/carbamoylase family amidase n=1 Tax=Aurantiacibacter rhizosphaerae TaxID=2691582 RepID=A0A844XCR3_9SPHN|nr:Zn-dependent hydrolase [Aurantiacibacter rhizosphaerae]MWV27553.1 hydantoinase/carbamoylase family amidase [Aurantiacibacter rhizosphaerae]